MVHGVTRDHLSEALALRWRCAGASDAVLLDWLDLARLLPELPCQIGTQALAVHWDCSQPTVSRRLSRLWDANLIDYRPGRGRYRIRRLGPP